ncbi:RluA family pseudouridine synthase [Patescibacteria group bacterium]|nr:RluA family pseudouridine synthase [Patescibacteria group bacterium]
MEEIIVSATGDGKRLDILLHELHTDITRSQLQKKIKSGMVLVNGHPATVHQWLKPGDVIIIDESLVPPPTVSIKEPAKSKKSVTYTLDIIDDTKEYLVINKQSGLLVHEAPGNQEQTLVDLVLEKYPHTAKVGEDPMRPGIVHRLDKEVSGLIVVAKTQNMFDHLKNQFKNRIIRKEYLALVHGAPQTPVGEINFSIDRSETVDHKMAAVPAHEGRGRRAITQFELIERLGNYSLIKLSPRTGRTHQIRVHLNAYGLPIVGDLVYRPKKLKSKLPMDRIFLHATYLGFNDIANEWQDYSLILPPKLQDIIDSLKKN